MRLTCVQCVGELSPGAKFCPACGRATDADGNGMPDALDRVVRDAAREAVAEERRAQGERHARERTQKDLARERTMTEMLLRGNLDTPRSWPALALRRLRNVGVAAFVAMVVLGFVPRMILAPFGMSVSGWALCPIQCEGCAGPGRAFEWRYRGPWQSNKGRMGYALACHNPRVDVEQLTVSDVLGRNDELQPYLVSGLAVHFADAAIVAVGLGLMFSVVGTGRQLRGLDAERAALERRLREIASKG